MTRSGRWIDNVAGLGDGHLPTRSAAVELRRASALLDAAARMHDSRDLPTLVGLITTEALAFVPADGALLLEHHSIGSPPILVLAGDVSSADDATARRCLRLVESHLPRPGQVVDLGPRQLEDPVRAGGEAGPPDVSPWRSLLLADLEGTRYHHRRSLLWYAREPGAFGRSEQLAELFARHAGLALRTVAERHHLERAVEGRTTTGQATGVLMSRYGITAARAFEMLRRYSQVHNVKLQDIAEGVSRTGDLPS